MIEKTSHHEKPSRTGIVAGFIAKHVVGLGLASWTLSAGEDWPEKNTEDDAFVWRQPSEQHAIVFVNPDQPDSQIERLVVHEMLHLAHVRLDELASNGQPVGVIEAYDRELETFLNIMATALTGIEWLPTGDWAERFEVKQDEK